MRVGDMQVTTLVRQRGDEGMRKVSESIRAIGWVEQSTPSVMVDRGVMPADIQPYSRLTGVEVSVLDGNHRVLALNTIKGPNFEINVRVYHQFDKRIDATSKVLANGECALS